MGAAQGNDAPAPAVLIADVDGSAAFERAAGARNFFDIGIEMVVDRQFLAFPDIARRNIQNMAADNTRYQVRVAAMINILRARAIYSTIYGPVTI